MPHFRLRILCPFEYIIWIQNSKYSIQPLKMVWIQLIAIINNIPTRNFIIDANRQCMVTIVLVTQNFHRLRNDLELMWNLISLFKISIISTFVIICALSSTHFHYHLSFDAKLLSSMFIKMVFTIFPQSQMTHYNGINGCVCVFVVFFPYK